MNSVFRLLFVGVGLAASATTNLASAGAAPVSAVIGVDVSAINAPTEIEQTLAVQVRSGLESSGLDIKVPADVDADRARSCGADEQCLHQVARTEGVDLAAKLVVTARPPLSKTKTAKKSVKDFEVSLTLAAPSPSSVRWQESQTCRGCDVNALKEIVFLSAAHVGTKVLKELPAAAPVPAAAVAVRAESAPPLVAPVQPSVPPTVQREATATPMAVERRSPWPWYAVGAGALLIGGGFVLRGFDGDPACDLQGAQQRCPERYNTGAISTAFFVGGTAALVTGAVAFIFRMSEGPRSVSLTAGPRGFSLGGRF